MGVTLTGTGCPGASRAACPAEPGREVVGVDADPAP